MPYSYATLVDSISALSARLYGSAFFTSAELTSYLVESLRTWNSYTSFQRSSFTFPLLLNTHWYDLTTQSNSTRPLTLTDQDLISLILYHLLEPQNSTYPLSWAGSTQFSFSDILTSLQRRQDETLSNSGCTLALSTYPAVPGQIYLVDSTIDIRRVAWLPQSGFGYVARTLRPSDPFEKASFNFSYTTSGQLPPDTYIQSTEPPISFSVDHEPPCVGDYEVVSVNAGAAPNSVSTSALSVPDDFSWVVKFGMLADLLSREANSKDSLRAQYCESRYREGTALLSLSPSILDFRINNIPISLDALRSADDFNSLWQSRTPAQPISAYTVGLNLLAVSPKPDSSTAYSATVKVVANMTVPVNLTDQLQIGRDDYNSILDYAQHLASFKMGGAEFLATIPLYQRFLKQAALYNSKLSALGQFHNTIFELAQLNTERSPIYSSTTPSSQVSGSGGSDNGQ